MSAGMRTTLPTVPESLPSDHVSTAKVFSLISIQLGLQCSSEQVNRFSWIHCQVNTVMISRKTSPANKEIWVLYQ